MTYVVALTGGVGSGKSTVARFFAELGAPIIDADHIAHVLVKSSEPAFQKIVERFGPEVLNQAGELNRPLLREKIFNNTDDKKWLEALLHPAIYHQIQEKIREVNYAYCIVVVPLLAEHYEQYQHLVNHVLVVDTTQELQLKWAVKRDNCDESLVKKIMCVQTSRAARLKIADTVLHNEGTLEVLKKNIMDLHLVFLKK